MNFDPFGWLDPCAVLPGSLNWLCDSVLGFPIWMLLAYAVGISFLIWIAGMVIGR
jgi:hypothetical protein